MKATSAIAQKYNVHVNCRLPFFVITISFECDSHLFNPETTAAKSLKERSQVK